MRSRFSVLSLVVLAMTAGSPARATPGCPAEITVATGHSTVEAMPGCALTGVRLSVPGGGVEVPPPGRFVTFHRGGETPASLVARHHPDGRVEVDAHVPEPAKPTEPAAAADAPAPGDDACTDAGQVVLTGAVVVAPIAWTLSLVDERGLPPEEFRAERGIADFWTSTYLAGTFLQRGHNDCGLAEGRFSAAPPVLPGGYSTLQTNVSLWGYCRAEGDGRSTVQVATMMDSGWAIACTWGTVVPDGPDETREFDIRVNDERIFSTDPIGAGYDGDLLGVLVHEWGHVYGLAHAPPGHPYLTMNDDGTFPGPWLRTLGLGDYRAMSRLYAGRPGRGCLGCVRVSPPAGVPARPS